MVLTTGTMCGAGFSLFCVWPVNTTVCRACIILLVYFRSLFPPTVICSFSSISQGLLLVFLFADLEAACGVSLVKIYSHIQINDLNAYWKSGAEDPEVNFTLLVVIWLGWDHIVLEYKVIGGGP